MQNEEKPGQHTEKSEGSSADADPKSLVHQTGDRKPNNDPTQHIARESHPHVKPRLPLRLWRYFRRRQIATPPANWAEMSTVLITLVIALVGAVQAGIYWQQKGIMESSSTQTDQLICAANIQADAATRSAKAAQDFAVAAQKQSDAMAQTLALQRELARLDRGGARLAISMIGVYHSNSEKRLMVNIVAQNNGK